MIAAIWQFFTVDHWPETAGVIVVLVWFILVLPPVMLAEIVIKRMRRW